MSQVAKLKEDFAQLEQANNLNIRRTERSGQVHIVNFTNEQGKEVFAVINELSGRYLGETNLRTRELNELAANENLLAEVIEEYGEVIAADATIEKIHWDGKHYPVLLLKYTKGEKECFRVVKPGAGIYKEYASYNGFLKAQFCMAISCPGTAPKKLEDSIINANLPLFFPES